MSLYDEFLEELRVSGRPISPIEKRVLVMYNEWLDRRNMEEAKYKPSKNYTVPVQSTKAIHREK